MKLIIDISDEVYANAKNGELNEIQSMYICGSICNGTPLPKRHGELIDKDETLKAMNTWDKFGYTETGCLVREPGNDYVPYVHYEDMVKAVSGMPTVIDADRGEK